MSNYSYRMNCEWRIKPTPPVALGRRFLRTLDLIAEAAPEIGSWKILTGRKESDVVPIDDARDIIGTLVENYPATIDDIADPQYGYNLFGSSLTVLSSRRVSWCAGVGGKFGDDIRFRVGEFDMPSDLDIVTYRLFRAALLATIAQWPSNWANAYAYRSDYDEVSPAPGIPSHPRSRYLIPWLSYLSARLSADFDPPAEILSERTPDGGLLMIATEERLDPTNPEQMRRSRMMAEIMIAHAGNP